MNKIQNVFRLVRKQISEWLDSFRLNFLSKLSPGRVFNFSLNSENFVCSFAMCRGYSIFRLELKLSLQLRLEYIRKGRECIVETEQGTRENARERGDERSSKDKRRVV